MDNKKLIELIANWRKMSQELTNGKKLPDLSNSESWLMSSTLEQCADELGDLIYKEN